MNKVFVWGMVLFIGGLTGVGIFFIILRAPSDKSDLVERFPINASEAIRENPMILIPAGEFIMGSEDGGADEVPVRTVFLDAYKINQYEVTQHQYGEFVKATGHRSPISRYVKNIHFFDHPNQPVVYVSWPDAYDYCRWRGQRLPTEAEWEKAARGQQGNTWPWVEDFKPAFANFKGERDKGVFTMTVGSYETDQSPYRIYDMSGNVREWVQDWYDQDYYKHAPLKNPKGPKVGEVKVMRGSSWNDSHFSGRTTARLKMIPNYRETGVGFRCAETIDEVEIAEVG
ncbi:MAG: formylglycine-generating enzyme family protein [Nitrospiria bacterium]